MTAAPKKVRPAAPKRTLKKRTPRAPSKARDTGRRTRAPAVAAAGPTHARGALRERAILKVIRDSFTMPEEDYRLIDVLKRRCLGLGIAIKKSELLRAGLAALHRLPEAELVAQVGALKTVKTGRPVSERKPSNHAKGSKR